MKKLLFTLCAALFSLSAFSQIWSNLPMTQFGGNSTVLDVEMNDGKVYLLESQSTGNVTKLYVFNNFTGTWQAKASTPNPRNSGQIYFDQDSIYVIVDRGDFELQLLHVNLLTNSFEVKPSISIYGVGGAYRTEFVSKDEIYILKRDSYTSISLNYFNGTIWTQSNLNSYFSVPTGPYAMKHHMSLAVDPNFLYVGYGETSGHQLYKLPRNPTFPATLNTYDGSANGYVRMQSTATAFNGLALLGNLFDAPGFIANYNKTALTPNYTSFNEQISTTTLNFDNASQTLPYNFNPTTFAYARKGSYVYLFSQFNTLGQNFYTPNRTLRLLKRDLSTPGNYIQFGPDIQQIDSIATNVSVSEDNLSAHVSVQYKTGAVNQLKILNQLPQVIDQAANTGLCTGSGLLYPNVKITDGDGDKIQIISATVLNNSIDPSCLQIVSDGQVGNISKFKIFGCLFNSNTDALIINYTDGYSVTTDTLGFLNGSATPAPVTFNTSNVNICKNENIVSLGVIPSVIGGVFSFNGEEISLDEIDVNEFIDLGINNGVFEYSVYNPGGCKRTGLLNFTLVDAPVINLTSSPSDCDTNTGAASATFTAGSTTTWTWEWSNGASTNIIQNLSPGPYYCMMTDANGCKATGLANVLINGLNVSANIVQPSCFNSNDGSIDLIVSGTGTYSFIWSNGKSTEDIGNLNSGNYEVSIYDAISGCSATYSYILNNPPRIKAEFSVYEPDCGLSNGVIYGTFTGGTGTLSYNWENGLATTQDLTNQPFGLYSVEVSDQNGCSREFSKQLDEWQALLINDTVVHTACNDATGAVFTSYVVQNGGAPLSTILWSNQETTSYVTDLAQGNYYVTATTTSGCKSGKAYKIKTLPPAYNPICLVTVDGNTNTNEVVWEKVDTENISHYNIYREQTEAGEYMLIDTVNFSSNSVFNDVVANAENRSFRYKIAAVNVCNTRGPVSLPHKTMHMTTINLLQDGSYDIFWDDYEGRPGIEYVVRRFSAENGWEDLSPTVAIGVSVFNDLPPSNLTNLDYEIEMSIQTPCDPNPFKAEDYNYVRSNREKGKFAPGFGTGESSNTIDEFYLNDLLVSVYPNPFTDEITVAFDQLNGKVNYQIISMEGRILEGGILESTATVIDLGKNQSGMYFLKLSTNVDDRIIKIQKL